MHVLRLWDMVVRGLRRFLPQRPGALGGHIGGNITVGHFVLTRRHHEYLCSTLAMYSYSYCIKRTIHYNIFLLATLMLQYGSC